MKDFDVTYWPSSNSKDLQWVKDYYYAPEEFIGKHRKLTNPCNENRIIVALKSKYKLYYYEKGTLIKEYEIALSQNPIGHKEREGDLKLPEGEYYICEKQKGPFNGYYADFLGPRLLRISYPNIYDAENGLKKGLISKKERDMLVSANINRTIPSKGTKLGGGIVIHGWKGDWIANGRQNLTWGCISMHNSDLEAFYDIVKLNTKIIILE
jgi:murein L,D-transpeptidase YafK